MKGTRYACIHYEGHRWFVTLSIGGIKMYWHCMYCHYKTDLAPERLSRDK